MCLSPLTSQLIEALSTLPSIGNKTAQRLAFHLLTESSREKGTQLAAALTAAMQNITFCNNCRAFCEEERCALCSNPKRNHEVICIVETQADLVAIENSQQYNGLYFVLHGRISPLDGIGPKECHIPSLIKHIITNNIKEVILATSSTMEGEATSHFISHQIQHSTDCDTQCTRLAQGVPMGGELEYLDHQTIRHAFSSRSHINLNNNDRSASS